MNVPLRRTAHCFHIISANDTKESVSGHRNSLPMPGINPGTSRFRGQCAYRRLVVPLALGFTASSAVVGGAPDFLVLSRNEWN